MQTATSIFAAITLSIFCLDLVVAQSAEDKKLYAEFADAMDKYGYTWEPHKVKTEDLWNLTIFRITGKKGKPTQTQSSDKYPVLAQHGATDSALGWAIHGTIRPTMPMKLVDHGYDVWLGNARGVIYSDSNDRDGTWTDAERWNFTWADLGTYDIPAVVTKILEVTAKDKVTMMGHSQGTSQIFYALAKN